MEITSTRRASTSGVLLGAVGVLMIWAGHDVTDSVRTIVVLGGWLVAALGVGMVALGLAVLRAGSRNRR